LWFRVSVVAVSFGMAGIGGSFPGSSPPDSRRRVAFVNRQSCHESLSLLRTNRPRSASRRLGRAWRPFDLHGSGFAGTWGICKRSRFTVEKKNVTMKIERFEDIEAWRLGRKTEKMRKIFFWDTGIRNAVINQFAPLE
jgi:hypothetical protein